MSLLTSSAVNKMVRNYEGNLNSSFLNSTDSSFQNEIAHYRISVATSLSLLVGIIQLNTDKNRFSKLVYQIQNLLDTLFF